MKTKSGQILIHSVSEKVFQQIDDFVKVGMHMSDSSMMMGSKLKLEQLSSQTVGSVATYLSVVQ